MCVECVLVWNCFQNVWKLLKMYLFFFFFILPCTPARPREANQANFWYTFFLLSVWPPKWERDETEESKWRPRLAQASGLAGHVPLSSKGKIAKRVVWMIALAGCAQAGWIARGTRPEQGEPIYILCNFYNVHSMTHLVLLFLIHLLCLLETCENVPLLYIICISIFVLLSYNANMSIHNIYL